MAMNRNLKTFAGIAFIVLLSFNMTSSAAEKTLKWIPENERQAFRLSDDFQTLDGKKVSLMDLKAKAVFVNLWATWCGPCKKELPSMGRLYTQLKSQGLEMIAVSNEKVATVQKFLKKQSKQPLDFTVLLNPKDTLGVRVDNKVVPTTIILDAQGRIAMRRDGEWEWDKPEVVEAIRKLMDGQQP
jgi:thiol-disulfide isomerase/thioredoxin